VLLAAITPVPGEAPAKAASKAKLANILDTAFGDEDQGHDPKVFEVDLLVRRLDRIEAEQQIVAKLGELRKGLADDILNQGAPGVQTLVGARRPDSGSAAFRPLLAPLSNALHGLTRAARTAEKDARGAAAKPPPVAAEGGQKATPPKAAEEG